MNVLGYLPSLTSYSMCSTSSTAALEGIGCASTHFTAAPAASALVSPCAEAPKFSSRKTKADLDGLTDEQQVGPITYDKWIS